MLGWRPCSPWWPQSASHPLLPATRHSVLCCACNANCPYRFSVAGPHWTADTFQTHAIRIDVIRNSWSSRSNGRHDRAAGKAAVRHGNALNGGHAPWDQGCEEQQPQRRAWPVTGCMCHVLHHTKPELRRPKEGLHNPRAGLCLRFLQRLHDHANGRFLVEGFAVAGHHGHVPVVLRVRLDHLFSLVNASVTRVCTDMGLISNE